MSDERDETRPGDASPASRPDDPGATRPDDTLADDDRTRISPMADLPARRLDSTSEMPPADDDWAASRANPVWSGRAEVRSPLPGRSGYDTDWPVGPVPEQRDHWWMPIVVGILVLVLLGLLAWGVYVIVQNSGNDSPGPAPTTAATATTAAPTESTEPTTTPTTEPTTTTPTTTTSSTTDPTTTEVTVPALRGQSLAAAQAALARTGLKSRVIYRSSVAPPGTVIDSDPPEGQEVPPDTTVTLVVAKAATTTPTATATTNGPAAGGD